MAFLTGTPLDDAVSQFMIQLLVMLITPKLLNVVLKHIQQPLVVSEILSGVILGPSVMGLIPGFTSTIFPSSSLPSLNIVAQLGLVLFLFMVGLNLDPTKIKQYWRKSAVACAFGLVFPFVVAVPIGFLLNNSDYTLQNLGLLIGFIGLAFYISALSVLARILAERRLLDSGLGTMSLTSAAIDTFIAWIILAVILAFATTESNGRALAYLDPLWTMLLAAGHMVVLWFVVRRMLKYLSDKVKKSGTLTPLHFTLFLLIVFAVSWFTDQIGVSAMFGAFEVGVLIPRKGPAARLIKDKLEDLVVGIMLPVFFTYSGLRTDLRLINTGEAVGYTFLIIVVAMASKIFPVMVAAKIFKLDWFESLAFGVLMSCKGLVALVMFNIAADKKIITPKLFTMLVVYCIVATFVVTPVTTLILDHKKAKEEREIVLSDLETHNILALPQAPKFSPPVISFAHSISQFMGLKKKKIFVVRFFDLSDRISDMMSVKPKYDLILGPAIQRSHFFKIPLILKSIVTGNEVVEFDKFVFAHNIHTAIIGYDGTDITKHLISGALRARLCDVAVQCGQDLGHVSKILVIYGNTENDEAAFQFVANILASEKAEVTILNVSNDIENSNLTAFEEKFNLNNKTIIHGTGAEWVDSVLNTVDLSSFSVIIAGFIPHAPSHVRPAEFFNVLDRVIENTHTPFVLVHTKSQNIFEESPSLLRSTFNLMTSMDRSRKNSQTDEGQELEQVQTVSQRPNRTVENDDV